MMKLLSKIPLIMMAGGLLLIGIGIKSFLRSKDFVEHSSLADGQIIERSDVYGGSKLGPRVDVKASFQDKNGKSFILSFTHVTATKFALNSSVKIVYDPKEPENGFIDFDPLIFNDSQGYLVFGPMLFYLGALFQYLSTGNIFQASMKKRRIFAVFVIVGFLVSFIGSISLYETAISWVEKPRRRISRFKARIFR